MRSPSTPRRRAKTPSTQRLASCSRQERLDLGLIDIGFDEGFPDAPREDERELAALYFLVLRHQVQQAIRPRQLAGNFRHPGRQADGRKMTGDAIGL